MMLLAMFAVWSMVLTGADAAGELLRPVLGGGVAVPTLAPYPAPTTPITTTQIPYGSDITLILLLVAAVFGFFGFFTEHRAVQRATIRLVVITMAYLVLDYAWGTIAKWINHFYKLFYFAIVERGIFVDDPTEAWKEVSGMDGPVPTSDDAIYWQIGLFLFAVGLAYFMTMRWRWPRGEGEKKLIVPSVAERLISSVLSAITGAMITVFILMRLVPNATIALFIPGTAANDLFGYLVVITLVVLVTSIIIFGYRNLKPKKTKMYP